MGLARRLSHAVCLSWQEQSDLLWAVWELGRAQRRLRGMSAIEIRGTVPLQPVPSADPILDRVAWAIRSAAAVVPWRSDCLRQAEAARHWLGRHGITTELRLGARKNEHGHLDAHAWLLCGERVVTGGNIDRYREFQ